MINQAMINQAKRDTVKKLSVATLAPLAPTAVFAGFSNSDVQKVATGQSTGITDLQIDIIASSETHRHTILLTNLTDSTLPVRHFSPGLVYWRDEKGQHHHLDMNALRSHVAIDLAPGQATSLSMKARSQRQTADLANVNNGTWADDAVTRLDQNTLKITLGAYQHQHQLIVYPIPQIQLFS